MNIKPLAAGIEFGGTKMLGVIVDSDGDVKATHRLPTPYDADELLDDVVELLGILEAEAGVSVAALGVGAGGLVSKDGVLAYGPNVGRVANVDVVNGVKARRPELEIMVDNDATCATWSEGRVGAGKGTQEMVLVTLGTGIGSGIISNGRIVRGANGMAGEHGHMTVEVGGIHCVCGKNGCWEAYASGRALGRMGRNEAALGRAHEVLQIAGAVEDIRGEHVVKAARSGNAQALDILDEFATWVAVGIANAIAITDPELVVVGGGLSEDADLFIPQTQKRVDEIVFGSGNRPVVPIVKAQLGERAGAIGAALMTFDV